MGGERRREERGPVACRCRRCLAPAAGFWGRVGVSLPQRGIKTEHRLMPTEATVIKAVSFDGH